MSHGSHKFERSKLLDGNKIEPCPHCNTEKVDLTRTADSLYSLCCCVCGAEGRRCWSIIMAVRFWNMRGWSEDKALTLAATDKPEKK